ncbi:FtsQ-type POTRA domain-containing protein [Weissella koreensis]|uniref:cell division protein FtsQ/DivIB n=1 Tax=Weissella koreensis TaxID=165096 RepID=UPI0022BA3D4E|nr:cell division protein FtsQ/DivIB [Weissella koreensis]MCZ9310562.1 FtsQ-type POTRA domain-containing protein [Weissella koreensis]
MNEKNKNDESKHQEDKLQDQKMWNRINKLFSRSLGQSAKRAPKPKAISKSQSFRILNRFNAMERNSIHMIVILSIISLLLILLLSPLMRFQKVEITGNHDLTKAEVLSASGINKKIPAWQLLSEQHYFIQRAEKNSQIKKVKISYLNMQVAQIKIEENSKVGLVTKKDKNYYILADGKFIPAQSVGEKPQRLPNYEKFPNDKTIKRVAMQFNGISKALQNSVSEVIWSPDHEDDEKVILIMDDGNKVLIKASDIKNKLKYYPGMVAQIDKNGTFNFQVGTYFQQY